MSDRDEREDNNHHEESERRDEEQTDRDRDRDGEAPREGQQEENKREGPTTSLLVRNIAYNVRNDDIRKLFSDFGEIRDVYIPNVWDWIFYFAAS